MLALDLFCGAGGVGLGLQRAGFRVIGIDHQPQPDYPGEFILADALRPPVDLAAFDLIWASPPCQHDSSMRQRKTAKRPAPNLVPAVQELLAGLPWTVIEQVRPEQLINPLVLEMGMFAEPGQCGNYRRRYFQCSWPLLGPPLPPRRHYAKALVCLTGTASYGPAVEGRVIDRRLKAGLPYSSTPEEAAEALGVQHIVSGNITQRRTRINNALPPEYSEFIGRQRKEMK